MPAQPETQATPGDDTPSDATIILDPSAPRQARIDAALRLIESTIVGLPPDAPPSLDDNPVVQALESDVPSVVAAVLEALSRLPIAPRVLWQAVSRAAHPDSPHDPRLLASAIATFRTPDAAQVLLQMCDPKRPGPIRDAGAMKAAEILAFSPATPDSAWAWYEARLDWPRLRWADHIAAVLAASHRAERARADAAERRLLAASRRLWASAADVERPPMLDEFLASDVDALRLLAIELIREQIASARPVPSSTIAIATAQLASPRAAVRADAAMLIAQIAPPEAAPSVLIALLSEADPHAAEQLMLASARWPTPEAVEPVLRWLNQPGATAIAAGDTAYALHRQGLIAPHVDRLLSALRALDEASVNGGACRLLIELGDASDRGRVMALLRAQRPTLRLAAATALIPAPEALDALLAAATTDPNLADAAIRAVLLHARNEAGVLALDGLHDLSASPVVDAQREILAGLPMDRALTLTERIALNPCRLAGELRAILLHKMGDADTQRPTPPMKHLAHLARAELDCGDAARAADVLAQFAPDQLTDDGRTTLAQSLIRLDRLDEAWRVSTSADLWLAEFDRLRGSQGAKDRAPLLARFMLERLSVALAEDQAAQLAAVIPPDAGANDEPPPEPPASAVETNSGEISRSPERS